jgi:Bifunctional DNA primase/polymerase, N-terminal
MSSNTTTVDYAAIVQKNHHAYGNSPAASWEEFATNELIGMHGLLDVDAEMEIMCYKETQDFQTTEAHLASLRKVLQNIPVPDKDGRFFCPADGAIWMLLTHGIPQTPLKGATWNIPEKERGKVPFLPGWTKPENLLKTADAIRDAAKKYPGCNFGSVFNGDFFAFEADTPPEGIDPIRKRFEDAGGTFTSQLIILSSEKDGTQRGHRYYRWVPGIENIGQSGTATKHGDFSLRVHGEQCVSPGSVHPKTNDQYRVMLTGTINTPSVQEVEFWNNERVKSAPAAGATNTGNTATPRRKLTEGQMHGAYTAEAGRLWNRGYDADDVVEMTIKWMLSNTDGRVDVEKVRKEARDIVTRYPQGSAPEAFQLELNQEAAADDEPEEIEPPAEPFPNCPIFTGSLTDLARAMFPSLPLEFKQWGLITHFGLLRSGVDTLGYEKHLQPRFYTIFVCNPNTGKTASLNESRKAMGDVIQRYTSIFDSSTKTRPCSVYECLPSVDSGQFLAEEFSQASKRAVDCVSRGVCSDNGAKLLIDTDELNDIFEKGRTSIGRTSTVFTELLKLHSGNRTGSGTKKEGKIIVESAHLAIAAGTTTRKYPILWTGTGSGADGLRSRFLPITSNNSPVPPKPLVSDFMGVEQATERIVKSLCLPAQNISISTDAIKMLEDWWAQVDKTNDNTIRVLEFIKQLLMVLALVNAPADYNGTELIVGVDLMTQAIEFGKYVIAIRDRLNPDDSWSQIQSMENDITKWIRKYAKPTAGKSQNECRQGIRVKDKPGGYGVFLAAWKNCVAAGVLKPRGKNRKGFGIYSL